MQGSEQQTAAEAAIIGFSPKAALTRLTLMSKLPLSRPRRQPPEVSTSQSEALQLGI